MDIPYDSLVSGLRKQPKVFLGSLFGKGHITYLDTDAGQLPLLKGITLVTLLLGNWRVTYKGVDTTQSFTILAIPLLLLSLIGEALYAPLFRLYFVRLITKLEPKIAKKERRTLSKKKGELLYLRTDLLGQSREGGSFTHVAGFIGGAEASGWKTTLIASGNLPTASSHVEIIPYSSLNTFSMEVAEMHYGMKLAWRLREGESFDCIYQRHSGFNITGLLLASLWKVPFVLEVNNLEIWIRKNWGGQKTNSLLERTERLIFQAADVIVVVSDVLKQDLVAFGVPAEKILVNPNGVDPEHFTPEVSGQATLRQELGIKKDDVVVGFIGSFGVWHGLPVLAEAIPSIRKANPHVKFLLIGDGELRQKLESQLTEYTKDKSVIFTGRIPHAKAPLYLAACDIFASPHIQNEDGSRFFGSPTKLFEYMAAGRAIVASNLEQIGEILTHKKNALLTKPGDAPALAEAILLLSKDSDLRNTLGKAAHNHALTTYTWKANAQAVFKTLQS
jgi:glycosyltransferase involved in cell wall biosynthesis